MQKNISQDKSRTVWIGDLDGFEDEKYFSTIFTGKFFIKSIKIKNIQNRSQYAFLELSSQEEAQDLIDQYHNKPRPLSNKYFKKLLQDRLGLKK